MKNAKYVPKKNIEYYFNLYFNEDGTIHAHYYTPDKTCGESYSIQDPDKAKEFIKKELQFCWENKPITLKSVVPPRETSAKELSLKDLELLAMELHDALPKIGFVVKGPPPNYVI